MSQELKDHQNQIPEEEIPKWGRSVTKEPRVQRSASGGHVAQGAEGILKRIIRPIRLASRRLHQFVREEQAYNFPESDSLLVQLLLLFWNMLPVVASVLKERIWKGQKQMFHKLRGLTKRIMRRKIHPAGFMIPACLIAAIILFCSTYTLGTTVSYDGEVVGTVASKSQAESARSKLEKITTSTLGTPFAIEDSMIHYSSGLMKRQALTDQEAFEEELSEEIGLVTSAYCLYVDGERIGATPYEGALEELLEQLQKAVINEDTISCSFAENVEIKEEFVPTEDIMNLGYLAETLYSTKAAEVTYEVKRGDTWSQIAEKHGLTSKELLALNPGYNINQLQIGEILTLSASVPYLTMTVVQQEHYVDDVNYKIEYTDSADMYQGDYKITSKGEYGKADVVANVTYVNGQEVERTILSSVTLKEPVTEQRLQGTKERPTWYPTGSFRWPTSGRVTSYFGGRKSPGGIGSTNHKGLDIANSRGTAIYAADGGRVTYSGWMSGYGYTVRIDHLNGFTTFYAHNSSLLVKSGQTVYKGQQIAKMGSTGNSTGSHCHFEIRYNGTARNPMNYLS